MIHVGDCIEVMRQLEAGSAQTCVTSPPYFGLRDYGCDGQIGLEESPEAFVTKLVEVFREVRRVLRDDGTLWMNLGDSYNGSGATGVAGKQQTNAGSVGRPAARGGYGAGLKQKDLIGIPWRVAFALQADGWYLRQDIIWAKPNPMPESVRDRCTKAHEYLFLLTKAPRYYYDAEAIKEPAVYGHEAVYAGTESGLHSGESHEGSGKSTRRFSKGVAGWATGHHSAIKHNVEGRTTNYDRVKAERPENMDRLGIARDSYRAQGLQDGPGPLRNKRSVWTVATQPYSEAHFATFPENLVRPCIMAGSKPGDTVLDPFMGAGTTAVVATALARKYVGAELNPKYAAIAEARIRNTQPGFSFGAAP